MLTSHLPTDQTDHIQELKYSLSKRVPDMLRGFSITTCYGEININPEFAEAFRNLAADVLQYQLNLLKNQEPNANQSQEPNS